MVACDFLVSVCVAATKNLRKDTVLRPFPPGFIGDDGEKDFEALTARVNTLPPLRLLPQNMHR